MSSSIASAALCARLLLTGAVAATGADAGAVFCGATTGLLPESVDVDELPVSDDGNDTLEEPLLDAAGAEPVEPLLAAVAPVAPLW